MVERMKRALLVTVTAGVLLLAGCTATNEAATDSAARAAEAPSETTISSEAPLTAATPVEDGSGAADTPESAYLSEVRAVLPEDSLIPDATDGQLLNAAQDACEQMAAGKDFSQVSVIAGEQMNDLEVYPESALIAAVARKTICS